MRLLPFTALDLGTLDESNVADRITSVSTTDTAQPFAMRLLPRTKIGTTATTTDSAPC